MMIKVIAAAGLRVPKEDNVRQYITDEDVVDVPDTLYYRRLIADGDLYETEIVEQASNKKGKAND